MDYIEKQAAGKWKASYAVEGEGISLAVNLRRYECGRPAWDVVMSDGRNAIGRAAIYGEPGAGDADPEKVLKEAAELMREHMEAKMAYHLANYEKWKGRLACFEEAVS